MDVKPPVSFYFLLLLLIFSCSLSFALSFFLALSSILNEFLLPRLFIALVSSR